jgi:hypothetical protein
LSSIVIPQFQKPAAVLANNTFAKDEAESASRAARSRRVNPVLHHLKNAPPFLVCNPHARTDETDFN